jgi:hypothetical protein
VSATRWASDELLAVLACDISARPAAPGVADLAPYVRSARRTAADLILGLDPAGVEVARSFVAAECVCCSAITWELVEAPAPSLRITATGVQTDALESLVPPTIHIERVQ